MLSEQNIHFTNGSISDGLESGDSVKAVIEFIKNNFRGFCKANKTKKARNEKGLNQKLCIYLNQKINTEPFFFQHEFIEDTNNGNSPQVDIGTISKSGKVGVFENEYIEDDSFFSLEAKRLPQEKKEREKEYVVGETAVSGAMERFKKGLHGSRLKFAAIIGYVQKNDFDYWFLKINSWINELAIDENKDLWSNNDKIKKVSDVNGDSFIELVSENSRKMEGLQPDSIKIFHFWGNLFS